MIIPTYSHVSCPLCLSLEQNPLFLKNYKQAIDSYFLNKHINQPHFFQCKTCEGVFRNPAFILPETEEHKRYTTHENNLDDPKYLKYLSESIKPFLNHISPKQKGLDYGCGPTNGFEHILRPLNYDIQSYDKYFLKSDALIKNNFYDYIICHEVIEHFVNFKFEFEKVLSLLKPNGKLLIRTELYPEGMEKFETWYYKNDSTHVFFLSLNTLNYLQNKYELKLNLIHQNKFLLERS